MQTFKEIKEFIHGSEVESLFEEVETSEGKKKDLYITGPFLEGDVENRNGRIYPMEMLTNSVNTFMKEKVRGVGIPGELNHPQSSIQIDLDRVSHYITEMKISGNQGIGKAKIASTPKGQIARNLIEDGMILGVSTRGVGKLNNEDGKNIVSEFDLITVDIVSDPSAPNAFVEAVMESLEYYKNGNDIQLATTMESLMSTMNNQLSELPRKQEEKNQKLFDVISNVMNSL